jgi:hypothetical protein
VVQFSDGVVSRRSLVEVKFGGGATWFLGFESIRFVCKISEVSCSLKVDVVGNGASWLQVQFS